MKTPRELLGIRDDLAQKVAERQLDRHDAAADLRAAVAKYPELLDELADDWADTQIDRSVNRYITKRNKIADAEIARKLAELGLENPTLDGDVTPISDLDPRYSRTLADCEEEVSTSNAGAWRWVKSAERAENEHEVLKAAVDGDLSLTREQATDALKRMPEAKRKKLLAEVRTRLSMERRAYAEQRYGGGFGHAAEG